MRSHIIDTFQQLPPRRKPGSRLDKILNLDPGFRRGGKQILILDNNQSGNIFAIILLAVILFAALVFVFSRGLDTGATRMTAASARTNASDVISYAQTVERAVQKLLQNSISESDISFENGSVTGYDHTPAASASAKLFNSADGGGLNWVDPTTGQTPASTNKWLFTGDVIVTGQEDDTLSELLATLPVTYDVCIEINKQLNSGIDISSANGTLSVTKFTGTYADNATIIFAPGAGVTSGCIKGLITNGTQSGEYTFFNVLIAR